MNMKNSFDFAAFIYCDYRALSAGNRQQILKNIYQALVMGGKLLLDVFSMKKYEAFEERNTWDNYPGGGFWSANEHLAIERLKKYPDHVTLEQTLVIEKQAVTNYNIWNCYFTVERLKKEVEDAGFKMIEVFGDVTGASYTADSPAIAILLEK